MMTLQKNSVTRISEVYRNGDSSQKVTFYEKLHLKTVKKRRPCPILGNTSHIKSNKFFWQLP